MPLFSSKKFLPKKTPQRKTDFIFPKRKQGEEEFKFEIDKIKLNFGDHNAVFEDGEWIPESGTSEQRVKQQLQQLEMENNLLKLKNEVLLDMEIKCNKLERPVLKDISVSNYENRMCIYKSQASKIKSFQVIFEETFPELKLKRKAAERLEKIKETCRSEADVEMVMKVLRDEANMKSRAADIPPLLASPSVCGKDCICKHSSRLQENDIENGMKSAQDLIDSFSGVNKGFVNEFLKHPKDFGKISFGLNRNLNDCVHYYYLTKKGINSYSQKNYKKLKFSQREERKKNCCKLYKKPKA